jgi:hypothetical protein
VVVREQRSLRLETARTREYLLCRQRHELVPYRIAGLWIGLGRVDNLEDAVVEWVGVDAGGLIDDCFADLVEVAVGVCLLVPGGGVRFFVKNSILVAVDCGIET